MPKLKTVAPLPEQSETLQEAAGRPVHLEVLEGAVIGPRLAGTEDASVASPALSLQQLLIDGWEEGGQEDIRRWPPGVTILVSGGSAIVLWGLIIWAALALLHIHLS